MPVTVSLVLAAVLEDDGGQLFVLNAAEQCFVADGISLGRDLLSLFAVSPR